MKKTVRDLFVVMFAVTALLSLWESSANAQDQNLQLRIFAEAIGTTSECTDFESEDSLAIALDDVLFKKNSTGGLIFGEPSGIYTFPIDYQLVDAEGNVLLDLAGTRWERASILHFTSDGIQERRFWWLVEANDQPVSRISALTGPEGDVRHLGTCYLIENTSGADAGTYRISNFHAPSASSKFCINVGLFQR